MSDIATDFKITEWETDMFLGIVEINDRRYCCGVWGTIKELRSSIAHEISITPESPDSALSKGAVSVQYVEFKSARELFFDQAWGTSEDGFFLYEYHDEFPGFVGCDED